MERLHLRVMRAFQHSHLLSMKREEYRQWVLALLNLQLEADKRRADITVKSLFQDASIPMEAKIIAKEDGTVAGLEELAVFCESHKVRLLPQVQDGDRIKSESLVAEVKGSLATLLETERIRLDVLGRMSGIASLARKLSKRAHGIPLSATRKTAWGLLDKKAVAVGGGLTHRLGLWQAILIKDNHLAALRNLDVEDPFPEALSLAGSGFGKKIPSFLEIEVESFEEAQEVIRIFQNMNSEFPLAVLLDNFAPEEIQEVLKTLDKKKLRRKIMVEVSGGITEKNLSKYAETKPDLISLGLLTHSPRALDFSEQIVVETRAEPRS